MGGAFVDQDLHREQKNAYSRGCHRKCCDHEEGKRPVELGHWLSRRFLDEASGRVQRASLI
jgi:hypothetical protein